MASRVERIAPAFEGLDTESSPDYVTKNKAPLLENFLTSRPGKLVMRGPLQPPALTTLDDPGSIHARALWAYSETAVLALPAGETDGEVLDTTGGSATPVSFSTNIPDSGTRAARMGTKMYGLGQTGQVIMWNGATTFTKLTNAVIGNIDICTHLSRLFIVDATTLRWTDSSVNGPTTDLTTDWEDDVSGLDNQIVLPLSAGETPVALTRIGSNLAILTTDGIIMVLGDAPSKFTVRKTVTGNGCIDAQSVVVADFGIYYMSLRGFMAYDGSELRDTSPSVNSRLAGLAVDPLDPTLVHVSAGRLVHGSIFACFDTPSEGVLNYVMDQSGAWSQFNTATTILPDEGFYQVVNTGGQAFGWDRRGLWPLVYVDFPEAAPSSLRGVDTTGLADEPVAATWHSRLAALTMPHMKAVLRRLLIDYNFVPDDTPLAGWYVTLVDGAGTVLFAETQVPAQTSTGRARAIFDIHGETTDVQVRLRWDSVVPPALELAEVFDVTIEYDQAQQT